MMSWVTLHNLLAPDRNLRGAIPLDTLCKFGLGLPDAEVSEGTISGIGYIKKRALRRLMPFELRITNIQEFIDAMPELAGAVEWTFEPNGKFYHWVLAEINERPTMVVICYLDVSEWLREHPEAVKKIAEVLSDFWTRTKRMEHFRKNFAFSA